MCSINLRVQPTKTGHIREHATTSTGARARVTNDVESLLLRDLASHERSVRLESVDSGHVVALLVAKRGTVDVTYTGLDGSAIDDDGRAVVADGGHETARHILVASKVWRRD